MVLRRDGYQCQVTKRYGRRVEATTVHHVFPREEFPEYQWEPWNLISISAHTHELLHNRVTGQLSNAGRALQMEVSQQQGIPLSRLILVCGLPGAGKTTYVQRHLGGGLAYDLDYIAAAFRLNRPHMEHHPPARRMANNLCKAFAVNARRYVGTVYVIRTAPDMDEVTEIDPDSVVIVTGRVRRGVDGVEDMQGRLDALREWTAANGVPLTEAKRE
jgi:hypothetical protein